MKKRSIIITGGNSGLGYECAWNIVSASKEYLIVLACRNPEKASAAVGRLRKETGHDDIVALELELASLDSVRAFRQKYDAENMPPIYAIVCNAGLNPIDVTYTKDGFETTFGVNHLGHFLFANLMLKSVVNDGRIVFVSSDTHEPPKFFPFPAPVFESAEQLAHPDEKALNDRTTLLLRYPTSKLCNILCAYEMSDRLREETDLGITVNAFNPGLMTNTNFNAASSGFAARLFLSGVMSLLGAMTGRLGNVKSSGKALAAMITDKRYEEATKKYIDRGKEVKSSPASCDREAARKLWAESAGLVKLCSEETMLSVM